MTSQRPRLTRPGELPAPRVDADSAVALHALASLIAQAQQMIPDAVSQARDQEHTWAEIGQLLNLSPATAARRYRNHP